MENNSLVVAQRDIPGKEGKLFLSMDNIAEQLTAILDDFHDRLLQRAIDFRDSHIHKTDNYGELQGNRTARLGVCLLVW